MSAQPLRKTETDPAVRTPEEEAAAKAIGAWVQQFARTLKNCRLYDSTNPTVVRFREQLATALQRLLREQGSFTLRFTSDDVTYAGVSLYQAKSRDDNLALPFHRDGIRAVTFHESVEPRELDALLGALIRVTGPRTENDGDLVTLLWEMHLRNIDVDYVPAEGDVGTSEAEVEGELVPWPTPTEAEPLDPSTRELPKPPPDAEPRSDDWTVGEPTADFEAAFAELKESAATEAARFIREFHAEREGDIVAATIGMSTAFFNAGAEPADLVELGRFLPRLLRAAVQEGAWTEARETIGLLRKTEGESWSAVAFVQELQQPSAVASMQQRIAAQSEAELKSFIAFARELGDSTVDMIGQVIAELHETWQVQKLCEFVGPLCQSNPERLSPWLADRRPAVVRAGVHILGSIGGTAIVGPLQALARHPDSRVRLEVVLALRSVPVAASKKLLMDYVQSGDPRLVKLALQKLSEARDPQVAQVLLLTMIRPEFEERPPEEKHVIYSALGLTGGDEVVPELEAELLKGGWFERSNENHRQAVARCIARIGTPMARMVLEHGAQSRRGPVRDVCREMLQKWGDARV